MKSLFNICCVLFVIVNNLESQTYLKEFQTQSVEEESIMNIYDAENGIKVQSLMFSDPLQIISYLVDDEGDIVSDNEYGDTLPNYFRMASIRSDSSMQYATLDLSTKIIHCFDISSSNEITVRGSIEFFSANDNVLIQGFHRSADNYIVSGTFRNNQAIRRAFILWLDLEFNLIESYISTDEYNAIYSVTQDSTGQVYGLVNFVDFEFSNATFILLYGRHYVAKIDPVEGITPIYFIQEGRSLQLFGPPPRLKVSEQGDLIFSYNRHDSESTQTQSIVNINTDGSLNYTIDSLDIIYNRSDNLQLFESNNGELINLINSSLETDGPTHTSTINPIVSKVIDGEIQWSHQFTRYDGPDVGLEGYYTAIEIGDFLYFIGSTANIGIPLILKIDQNGCLTEDCSRLQVYGNRPPPTHSVSSRNIWHVYDKESQEQYRYTFVDQIVPELRGTLLRSDQMTGDNWYSTGRRFYSTPAIMGERVELIEGVDGSILSYDFDMDVGEYTELFRWFFADERYVSVTDVEMEPFNDGRQMRKLTLQCYESEANGGGVVGEMTHIPPMTWIDYIGNPDDLFNTFSACDSVRGSEVVTCFYSADQMMWSHPEYGGLCTTSTTEAQKSTESDLLLYPNPTTDYLESLQDLGAFRVVDAQGRTVLSGDRLSAKALIDVSTLTSGQYFLYEYPLVKGGKVASFLKQ